MFSLGYGPQQARCATLHPAQSMPCRLALRCKGGRRSAGGPAARRTACTACTAEPFMHLNSQAAGQRVPIARRPHPCPAQRRAAAHTLAERTTYGCGECRGAAARTCAASGRALHALAPHQQAPLNSPRCAAGLRRGGRLGHGCRPRLAAASWQRRPLNPRERPSITLAQGGSCRMRGRVRNASNPQFFSQRRTGWAPHACSRQHGRSEAPSPALPALATRGLRWDGTCVRARDKKHACQTSVAAAAAARRSPFCRHCFSPRGGRRGRKMGGRTSKASSATDGQIGSVHHSAPPPPYLRQRSTKQRCPSAALPQRRRCRMPLGIVPAAHAAPGAPCRLAV